MSLDFVAGAVFMVGVFLIGAWLRDRWRYRLGSGRTSHHGRSTTPRTPPRPAPALHGGVTPTQGQPRSPTQSNVYVRRRGSPPTGRRWPSRTRQARAHAAPARERPGGGVAQPQRRHRAPGGGPSVHHRTAGSLGLVGDRHGLHDPARTWSLRRRPPDSEPMAATFTRPSGRGQHHRYPRRADHRGHVARARPPRQRAEQPRPGSAGRSRP
jgi:hypothetical protein